jgi:hypothetical protein
MFACVIYLFSIISYYKFLLLTDIYKYVEHPFHSILSCKAVKCFSGATFHSRILCLDSFDLIVDYISAFVYFNRISFDSYLGNM